MAGDSEFCGFCNFAKGETVTAQIENLRRGAPRGRYIPVRQLVKKPSKEGRLRKVVATAAENGYYQGYGPENGASHGEKASNFANK